MIKKNHKKWENLKKKYQKISKNKQKKGKKEKKAKIKEIIWDREYKLIFSHQDEKKQLLVKKNQKIAKKTK